MAVRIEKRDIESFVKVFDACRREFGLEAVKNKLLELSNPDSKTQIELLKARILDEVAALYSISKTTLFTSSKHSVIPARTLCIILFKFYIRVSNEELSEIFDEHETNIGRKINQYKMLKENIELPENSTYAKIMDKKFMKNFEIVDAKIADYVNKLKN